MQKPRFNTTKTIIAYIKSGHYSPCWVEYQRNKLRKYKSHPIFGKLASKKLKTLNKALAKFKGWKNKI